MEKTNKQKMLSGEPFCSLDPDLLTEIRQARRLTRLINATTEDQEKARYHVNAFMELFKNDEE